MDLLRSLPIGLYLEQPTTWLHPEHKPVPLARWADLVTLRSAHELPPWAELECSEGTRRATAAVAAGAGALRYP